MSISRRQSHFGNTMPTPEQKLNVGFGGLGCRRPETANLDSVDDMYLCRAFYANVPIILYDWV